MTKWWWTSARLGWDHVNPPVLQVYFWNHPGSLDNSNMDARSAITNYHSELTDGSGDFGSFGDFLMSWSISRARGLYVYNLPYIYGYTLTRNASPWSWCISSYSHHLQISLDSHTRHQMVLRLTIQVHMHHLSIVLYSVPSRYLHMSIQTNMIQVLSMWIIFQCIIKSLLWMTVVGRERVQSIAWSGMPIPYNQNNPNSAKP